MCKNGRTDADAVWDVDSYAPANHNVLDATSTIGLSVFKTDEISYFLNSWRHLLYAYSRLRTAYFLHKKTGLGLGQC